MADRIETCPQCGRPMQLRLGEYECTQCGYKPTPEPKSSPPRPPAPKMPWDAHKIEAGGRDDGIKRARLIAPPPEPPVAPASRVAVVMNKPGDLPSIYSTDGVYEPPRVIDTLLIEKHIYFGLCILSCLVWLGIGIVLVKMPDPGMGGLVTAIGWGLGIGAVISALIMWYVIYSPLIWAKWTCMGCATFGIFSTITTLFKMLAGDPTVEQYAFQYGGLFWATLMASTFLQLGIQLWLISILYRDIKQVTGR